MDDSGYHYKYVDVTFDRGARTATLTVRAPEGQQPQNVDEIHAAGDRLVAAADGARTRRRHSHAARQRAGAGLLLLKTAGRFEAVLAMRTLMLAHRNDWLVRETIGMLRRTLARLDVSSRSMYAIIEPGSCFAGMLFELVLAADRSYMLALAEEEGDAPKIALDDFNFGLLPAVNDRSRLQTRFSGDARAHGGGG